MSNRYESTNTGKRLTTEAADHDSNGEAWGWLKHANLSHAHYYAKFEQWRIRRTEA